MDDSSPRPEPADLAHRWTRVAHTVTSTVVDAVADALPAAEPDPEVAALISDVLAVPGVAAMHPGPLGAIVSKIPGAGASGVARTDEETSVRVVLHDGAPVRATATAVRDAAARHTDTPVQVVIWDIS